MGNGSTDSIVLRITDLSHCLAKSGYGIPGVDAVLRRLEVTGFPFSLRAFSCIVVHRTCITSFSCLIRFRSNVFVSLSRVVVGALPYTNLTSRLLLKTYAMIVLKVKFLGSSTVLFLVLLLTCMSRLSFGRESCTLTYGRCHGS